MKPQVGSERADAGLQPMAAGDASAPRGPNAPERPDGRSAPFDRDLDAGSADAPRGPVAAISTMGHATCALMANGGVRCWGNNSRGLLGDGTNTNSSLAVQVRDLDNVVQIDLGYGRACAVLEDGTLRCWGDNNFGALRNGDEVDKNVPVQALGVERVAQVSVGESQTCVRHTDKTLECWLPVVERVGLLDANGATDVVDVEAGYFVTAAWFTDGSMRTWGEHALTGPLTNEAIRHLSSGYAFTCALLANGTVHCNGSYDVSGGGGGSGSGLVRGLSEVASIDSGFEHTCAVTSRGKVHCWGRNVDGQLGNGSTMSTPEPTEVPGLDRVVEVTCGRAHSCARTSEGHVYCWGANSEGELGDGTTVKRLTPVAVMGL